MDEKIYIYIFINIFVHIDLYSNIFLYESTHTAIIFTLCVFFLFLIFSWKHFLALGNNKKLCLALPKKFQPRNEICPKSNSF